MDMHNTAIKNTGTFDETCPQTELFSLCFCFIFNDFLLTFPLKWIILNEFTSVHSKSRKTNNVSKKNANKQRNSKRAKAFDIAEFIILLFNTHIINICNSLYDKEKIIHFSRQKRVKKEEAFFCYGNCCIKRVTWINLIPT